MISPKLVLFYLVIILAGAAYGRYKKSHEGVSISDDYALIKKYLLHDKSLTDTRKPFLWIHIDYEVNARNWSSWGSRNSTHLNQPYMYLCIRSIVEQCGHSFNVVLVDDAAFPRLLPTWTIQVQNMPSPLKQHLRDLAMAKVLHKYGGVTVPASFICLKDLKPVFSGLLKGAGKTMFAGEFVARSDSAVSFFPDSALMGCTKESPEMQQYIAYLEPLVTSDYTNEYEFLSQNDRWLYKQLVAEPPQLSLLRGSLIGTKTTDGKPVLIEQLLGEEDVDFAEDAYGIYVPADQILTRLAFQWFARLSPRQVLTSNTVVGKYLLLSNDR
uniref:Nucleotide-diphospho-sugar transferase domain-containing protein n=1 Tax=viral metagenome TaxID=1070528 RepID=A0A6C0M0D6_9ZZZZ